jgi:hypothetical protein
LKQKQTKSTKKNSSFVSFVSFCSREIRVIRAIRGRIFAKMSDSDGLQDGLQGKKMSPGFVVQQIKIGHIRQDSSSAISP